MLFRRCVPRFYDTSSESPSSACRDKSTNPSMTLDGIQCECSIELFVFLRRCKDLLLTSTQRLYDVSIHLFMHESIRAYLVNHETIPTCPERRCILNLSPSSLWSSLRGRSPSIFKLQPSSGSYTAMNVMIPMANVSISVALFTVATNDFQRFTVLECLSHAMSSNVLVNRQAHGSWFRRNVQ